MKTLADELAALTPEHRAQAEATLALRARAAELAKELGFDEGDVFHQLHQLARSPSERLRLGLARGDSAPAATRRALELAQALQAKLKP